MKKIVVSVCLLYAANGCAVSGTTLLRCLAPVPLIASTTYYTYRSDENEAKEIKVREGFGGGVACGALCGFAPRVSAAIGGIGAASAAGVVLALSWTQKKSLEMPEKASAESKALAAGVVSGYTLTSLLMYAERAIEESQDARHVLRLRMLELLRKMPK
jgi:hypothetical protein